MTKLTKREIDELYVAIYELFELHDCINEKDAKYMINEICDLVNEASYDYCKDNGIDNEYDLIVSD